MRQTKVYKNPIAALLWCVAFPGLGQLYNRDYILAFLLIGLEFLINIKSNLNLAILYSFSGDFTQAHEVINYQWGMFYPSIYCFSMWQAYNYAKVINHKSEQKNTLKETHLTGGLFGLVVGMNLGLFWHNHKLFEKVSLLGFMDIPVFNGLILGIVCAVLGAIIERMIVKRRKRSRKKDNYDC